MAKALPKTAHSTATKIIKSGERFRIWIGMWAEESKIAKNERDAQLNDSGVE